MIEANGTCSAITLASCHDDEPVCERQCNELTNCNWCRGMEGHPTCQTFNPDPMPEAGCTAKLDPSLNSPGGARIVQAWAKNLKLYLAHDPEGEPACYEKPINTPPPSDPAASFSDSLTDALNLDEYANASFIGGRGAITHWSYVYNTSQCAGDPACTCLDDPHTHYLSTTTTNATFTVLQDGTLQSIEHALRTVHTGCRTDTETYTETKQFMHLGTPTAATFEIGNGSMTCMPR